MECHFLPDTPQTRQFLTKAQVAHLAIPTKRGERAYLAITSRTWRFLRARAHSGLEKLDSGRLRVELTEAESALARSRLQVGLEGAVSAPPPAAVVDELLLRLHLCPQFSFEYLVRGKKNSAPLPAFAPLASGQVFSLDVAGGGRRYLFRVHAASLRQSGDSLHARFPHIAHWVGETGDHRLILSAGGGGFRFLGSLTALKILDLLGLRQNVSEIWGTSAGAMLTFPYACGLETQSVERLIYRFCYDPRAELEGASGPLGSKLFRAMVRGLGGENIFEKGMTRFDDWIRNFVAAVAREAHAGTAERTVPFFAVATNLDTMQGVALTLRSNARPYLDDFVLAATGREALQATASIPLLFPVATAPSHPDNPVLVDGGLCENLPLLLPYLKWKRDLAHDAATPRKLRIFFLEVRDIAKERPKGKRQGTVAWLQDVVNSSFYCNINLKLHFLAIEPQVEVVGIRIHLPDFSLLTSHEVHDIVLAGRNLILEEFDRLERELATAAEAAPTSRKAS